MKTIVDIKKIFYAPQMTTGTLTGSAIDVILKSGTTKEIKNVHATTWTYEEAEPSVTDYLNQLNGKVYYRDSTPGAVSVNFSIGQYDYQTKADLQGGTATATAWTRPETPGLVYKTLIAVTKDDTYIVFPKAIITARGGMVESKLIALLLSAVAMDTGVDGLASEGWFDASEIIPEA
ncbi:MAG: hypothetical protein LBU37_13385 [Tannerellaceae bacterium]|jgi:FlaG/FlaF family flagellin (archaellin)|nr:hypothetical protein [Tannerellaceae bacterium]